MLNRLPGRVRRSRDLRQWVNVKRFGALGTYDRRDNTGADDTAAIQAAIAYAKTNGIGTVYFPAPTNGKTYGVSSQIVVPEVTILKGDGVSWGNTAISEPIFGTEISARHDYSPSTDPVIRLGEGTKQFERGTGLEDIAIHCDGVVEEGVYSNTAQEPCQLNRVLVRGYTVRGFHFEGTAADRRPSHPFLTGCEAFPDSESDDVEGYRFHDLLNPGVMVRCSANGNFGGGTRADGVVVSQSVVIGIGCAMEGWADGWDVVSNGLLQLSSCIGHSSTDVLVHVTSGSLVADGISGFGSPTIIQDDVTGFTHTSSDDFLGRYSTRHAHFRSATGQPGRVVNAQDSASVVAASLEGDRATPADNDAASLMLRLSNDAGEQIDFAQILWTALDVSDGTEDAQIQFYVMANGTLTAQLFIQDNVVRPPTAKHGLIALGTATQAFDDLFLSTGGRVMINNVQVLTNQQAVVANANTGAPTAADCAARINDILARLRTHGIIAT
jgi:hypothetical protein